MKPSIGRIVHFVIGDNHVAAIITAVWSDTCVNLRLFQDGSNTDNGKNWGEWATSRSLDESAHDGTWHWPEKV